MQGTRVMVFYDGGFFRAGQQFFRYKEKRGWFSIPRLHSLLEKYVAQKAKQPLELTKVVGAHHYDGRTSTAAARSDQLVNDRKFEIALIQGGVVPHYLPLRETPRQTSGADETQFTLSQKGVDVQFALDVLDYAHTDRFDVAVLITGDADFVPLVRKITSIGQHALIAHFQIEPWEDDRKKHHQGTWCSRDLLDAASWSLDFNHLVSERDWKDDVKSLFFQPKDKD
jgi:hypothetical protein